MTLDRLRDLRNLGPASERALHEVGIRTPEQLDQVGAGRAYRMIREAGIWPQGSRNLLWAMAGALLDLDWRDLPDAVRRALLNEVEQWESSRPVDSRE